MHGRLVGVAVLGLALAGCVPCPNTHYYAPAVSGVILRGGQPVAGAQVQVTGYYSDDVRTVTTDRNGRFYTLTIVQLRLIAVLLGDPLFGYAVRVTVDGKETELISEGGLGWAPQRLEISCELTAQPGADGRTLYCRDTP